MDRFVFVFDNIFIRYHELLCLDTRINDIHRRRVLVVKFQRKRRDSGTRDDFATSSRSSVIRSTLARCLHGRCLISRHVNVLQLRVIQAPNTIRNFIVLGYSITTVSRTSRRIGNKGTIYILERYILLSHA